ncbi:NfeD family protein [Euzebya tangerina]|uniref:NfeD family protein n=1 Tax=Euzebya tangerina TaxID=591198 RepID=UPI000E31A0CE|nr:NfeD family protein [Euzebya tangerina]
METVWVGVGAIGLALLILTFVADTFELDLPGTDAGIPGEAIAGFLTSAGIIGYLMTSTGIASAVTVPVAVGAGVGMGAVTVALVRFFISTPTDATPTRSDFVGAIGKVVTPISVGGMGEVVMRRHGQPWKVAAQASDDTDEVIAAGTQVVVVQALSETRVIVTPADL